jgi:hypothetical protein
MTFSEQAWEDWVLLLPKWQAYKRTAAWTFVPYESNIIKRLALEYLGKDLKSGCGTCWSEAMRELERIAGQQ